MYELLKQKYKPNTILANKLICTGNSVIIEGNNWGDTFWGVCNGVGENQLGLLLMRIREELKYAYTTEENLESIWP